jgi:hypothetical protein
MISNIYKILIIIFTCIFSLACGLLLVQFLIPVYFKLFSPLPKTLVNFYVVMGVFSFLILGLVLIFFKLGKYYWAILILGSVILLYIFGIPIFMLENNNMLWHEAVFHKPGPAYFIDFSDNQINSLKHISDLYTMIWSMVHLYVYGYIVVYLAACFYLWKHGWRIGGVRIKL